MVQAATIVHQLHGDLQIIEAAGAALALCLLQKQTEDWSLGYDDEAYKY